MSQEITSPQLKQIMVAYGQVLTDHREAIDSLNVFPVPDGDTGTNMALTMSSALEHIDGQSTDDLGGLCQAISHGSLMGARGNSGVILSQILRGLCQALESQGSVTPQSLAQGWETAQASAYKAVLEPREGTILTVLSDIATQASQCAQQGDDIVELARSCQAAAQQSLDKTPELLEVLAEAGVVDAGGAGLVLIWDAVLFVMSDHELPPAPTLERSAVGGAGAAGAGAGTGAVGAGAAHAGAGTGAAHDSGDQRYEVMFFLDTPDDEAVEPFRQQWSQLGDSIVVVGGDGLWNCHIHTNQIGEAIEAGIAVGRPHQIHITDLFEQVEHLESDMQKSLQAAKSPGGATPSQTQSGAQAPVSPPEIWQNPAAETDANCAVVAVAVGDGIVELLGQLNVHSVVLGGQTMNPSTELLLEALEKVPAGEVLLLPNNKNIIPTASQAAEASSKQVSVLPSTSITEGIASLVAYDPKLDATDNLKAMQAEVADLVAGQVTEAVRDTTSAGRQVARGDYIGICAGEIVSVDQQLVPAVCGLLSEIITDEHELLMLFAGEPTSAAATEEICAWVAQHHGELEVELHDGGQPLYHYYLGLL